MALSGAATSCPAGSRTNRRGWNASARPRRRWRPREADRPGRRAGPVHGHGRSWPTGTRPGWRSTGAGAAQLHRPRQPGAQDQGRLGPGLQRPARGRQRPPDHRRPAPDHQRQRSGWPGAAARGHHGRARPQAPRAPQTHRSGPASGRCRLLPRDEPRSAGGAASGAIWRPAGAAMATPIRAASGRSGPARGWPGWRPSSGAPAGARAIACANRPSSRCSVRSSTPEASASSSCAARQGPGRMALVCTAHNLTKLVSARTA